MCARKHIHMCVGGQMFVWCAYKCVCVCVCRSEVDVNVFLNFSLPLVLRLGFSLGLITLQCAPLASQFALGNSLSLPQMGWPPSVFTWVLRIWTLLFMLMWPALYTWSHFPSPLLCSCRAPGMLSVKDNILNDTWHHTYPRVRWTTDSLSNSPLLYTSWLLSHS